MKRHNLPENGTVSRYGGYKTCRDCFEKIYSEKEWIESPCPGKILNDGALENMKKLGEELKREL